MDSGRAWPRKIQYRVWFVSSRLDRQIDFSLTMKSDRAVPEQEIDLKERKHFWHILLLFFMRLDIFSMAI